MALVEREERVDVVDVLATGKEKSHLLGVSRWLLMGSLTWVEAGG
jgi:hypothetical protein